MPLRSQSQRRFFRWTEKHPEESGVPRSVSKEFNNSDKGGKLPERVRKTREERAQSRYGGKKRA